MKAKHLILQRVFITKIPLYSDVASQPTGHRLKSERAYQYILGYRIYFTSDLKLTAESWYKKFDHLAVRPQSGEPFLNNNGTGHAYGFDFNITKRLSKRYHGQIGYSYMLSKEMIKMGWVNTIIYSVFRIPLHCLEVISTAKNGFLRQVQIYNRKTYRQVYRPYQCF